MQQEVDMLRYKKVLIQMNDPSDTKTIDKIAKQLSDACPDVSVDTMSSSLLDNKKVSKIINWTFYSVIAITMFLCFFSLCASMSSNLYEQKKEVAILRAIGITKIRVKLLYFYEALILVVASCCLGVLIGMAVAYMMIVQQNLALSQKLSFYFPWQQFLFIVGISIVCAFFSTWTPTAQLTNRPIAAIFRVT